MCFQGFRHGDRNPSDFLPDDPNKGTWGFEGAAELTNIGKMQAYTLGKMLRERYSKLLDPHFFPKEVSYHNNKEIL